MTSDPTDSGPTDCCPDCGRATRLRRLAAAVDGTIEAEHSGSTGVWTFVWTDGPTIEQVRSAAREADPDAAEGLRYIRRFSEDAVALGAVRLAVATTPADARRRTEITPRAVEEFWREVPLPSPCTERERRLVYAVVYQVRDDHRRNWADPDDICRTVAQVGLAPLLRRAGGQLTPLETLTAHYAATHAHPAWRYRLAPMTATTAFQAVRDDPKATRELLVAALTLLPALPEPCDSSAAELRTRLTRMPGNG
ncbi:hypothetical protein ACFT7S_20315 [Streptomyces sp. NPDC057136]|uniref:hypothetical protein n=1 Tax=Streptomyces sp. NPDC057136 TaxID=3346029 RepID=UPI003632AC56